MTKYRSQQLAQKRKKEFWTKTGLLFLFIVLIFFCVAELSKLHFLNIKEVSVEENKIISVTEINNIALEKLEGRVLWKFFPKRNIFIYPKSEIKDTLLQRFPRIKEIDLSLSGFKTLEIKIKEREPFALWCPNENCFLLDEEGYSFARAEGEDLFRYNLFVQHKTGKEARTQVFSVEKFEEINSFVDFLKGLSLKPYKFATDGVKGYEIYFGQGSKIIFGEGQEIRVVMENLQSVMNLEDFSLEEIDYIDLRFGNKVFYK